MDLNGIFAQIVTVCRDPLLRSASEMYLRTHGYPVDDADVYYNVQPAPPVTFDFLSHARVITGDFVFA